ncbi:MAG: hypothetical protein BGO70_10025 [Bacteroidetes bacterium 43-93]|nr:DUF58 domain-containing protein [Bacteroidota bacterium]OJX00495.1 MAG: hypothetical protein BGO70_10025 [Bacteroidetes bacterium 43-93]
MNWKQIKWLTRYYLQYFPFTINTLVCAVVAYVSYKILYRPLQKDEVAPFRPFILLMGKIVFWFFIALVLLSVLSTIASWLHYLWLKRDERNKLQISFTTETRNGKKNKLYLHAVIEKIRRPILGFVKARLYYDNNTLTETFTLLSNKLKEKSIWREAITGKSRMELPDIKEYELKGSFLFFEDMLQICKLTVSQPLGGHFYQPPVLAEDDDRDVYPKKTESMDVRIDQLRRVEGEYLNYKDFESGDDVRRIVWKVYAKNRDLVVRVPELYEPYASHLYFYASFNATIKAQWAGEGYMKEMLNYYKNYVWTVYDTLSKKEWALRYIPDQSFNIPEHLSDSEKASRIISNSSWNNDKTLTQYFNPRHGTVLCISSLTDLEELQTLLDQCDASTVIYFVKLSGVFRQFVAWTWLKRLIFLPPKDRLNKLRARWVFSPLRPQLLKREKAIDAMLQKTAAINATL